MADAPAKTARPVHVWRLDVTYPEGVDSRNPPAGWEPIEIPPDDQTTFSWPRRRHYMSREGAEDRARLLRRWGCTVTVVRSRPVEWE